jgi:hypothetical protein
MDRRRRRGAELERDAELPGRGAVRHLRHLEDRLNNCIASEQRTRDQLEKTWSSFSPSGRDWCVSSIANFGPTYTELASCLEMKRELANTKPAADTVPVPPPRRP